MSDSESNTRLKSVLLDLMESKAGVKEVCNTIFKNDRGEPLEITDYQAVIIKRIFFKNPKNVVCTASTRAGKSLAMSIGIILLACFRIEKIRLIAPTVDHTKIVMGYVIQHFLDHEICSSQLMIDTKGMGVERLKKELTKQKMTLKNGSDIMSITANIASEGRSLVGWGGTAIFVDEAEQITAEIMRTKVMRMLGDSPDASIFLIGNPVTHGYMWEKSTDPNWDFMKIDWKMCVAENRMTQEFIDERRDEMTSTEFAIWYAADWPEELEDQLFTQEDLDNIKAPLTSEEKELLTLEADETRLGCDIARFGVDYTVLYKAERYDEVWFLTESKHFEKKNLMETTGNIVKWDMKENFDAINVDDPGLGGGVTDRLKEIDQTTSRTNAFIGGEAPWKMKRKLTKKEEEDNKLYLNKKAFYYKSFESMARKGLVRLADEKNGYRLMNELKKMRYEFTSNGKMKIIDPEDKSPDWADAANIALFKGIRFAFGFA